MKTTAATNKLQEKRTRAGLRPEALAARAEISLSYLRKLEGGQSCPGLDVARRIAKALGTTVDQVFPVGERAA